MHQKVNQKFEFICTVKDGHRFFLDTDSYRVAIADNSGRMPQDCDKGPLYIDPSRPIAIRDFSISLPVLDAAGEEWGTPISIAEAVFVSETFELGLELVPECLEDVHCAQTEAVNSYAAKLAGQYRDKLLSSFEASGSTH